MIKIPVCCGKKMKINMELGRFVEVQCDKCGDTVYIKKYSDAQKPVLIDD
ncbi:MAG: hypothetical protein V1900_00315 [Candidatus Aenigmatarchaeota archaeon]